MCPNAGISVCATKISPHSEHFLPSVNPASVHVASFPASTSSVCSWGFGSSPFSTVTFADAVSPLSAVTVIVNDPSANALIVNFVLSNSATFGSLTSQVSLTESLISSSSYLTWYVCPTSILLSTWIVILPSLPQATKVNNIKKKIDNKLNIFFDICV